MKKFKATFLNLNKSHKIYAEHSVELEAANIKLALNKFIETDAASYLDDADLVSVSLQERGCLPCSPFQVTEDFISYLKASIELAQVEQKAYSDIEKYPQMPVGLRDQAFNQAIGAEIAFNKILSQITK